MHILLVEDNRATQEALSRILLETPTNQLALAESGLRALHLIEASAYDLYLIDFDLPDLHGSFLGLALSTAMTDGRLKQAPIIALTAQNDLDTRREADRCGFWAFIAKPCTADLLRSTIEQLTC